MRGARQQSDNLSCSFLLVVVKCSSCLGVCSSVSSSQLGRAGLTGRSAPRILVLRRTHCCRVTVAALQHCSKLLPTALPSALRLTPSQAGAAARRSKAEPERGNGAGLAGRPHWPRLASPRYGGPALPQSAALALQAGLVDGRQAWMMAGWPGG